jgi:mono/diheme cytochrome c family protein
VRRLFPATIAALIALLACDGGDLPAAYRDLEVPAERLASAEARTRGEVLYLKNCALCHGERGDGHGRRRNLSSRPQDFTDPIWARQAEPRRVYVAVREGVAGTAMASWKALDEDETWDVVAYVLSFAGRGRAP